MADAAPSVKPPRFQGPIMSVKRTEMAKTLKPSRFQAAEYTRAMFDAVLPADLDFDEVLKPGYWSNVVHLLKRNPIANEPDRTGALIHIGTDDHAFYGLLYVRAVLERGLIVQCIGPCIDVKTGKACPADLSTGGPWKGRTPIESDQFDLKWNLGKRGFDIIRKSDLQVVADGGNFPTREAAVEWINKTAKAH